MACSTSDQNPPVRRDADFHFARRAHDPFPVRPAAAIAAATLRCGRTPLGVVRMTRSTVGALQFRCQTLRDRSQERKAAGIGYDDRNTHGGVSTLTCMDNAARA